MNDAPFGMVGMSSPRARGGGPIGFVAYTVAGWLSPSMRGWPMGPRRPCHGRPVVPAHAGVVRGVNGSRRVSSCRPRARGVVQRSGSCTRGKLRVSLPRIRRGSPLGCACERQLGDGELQLVPAVEGPAGAAVGVAYGRSACARRPGRPADAAPVMDPPAAVPDRGAARPFNFVGFVVHRRRDPGGRLDGRGRGVGVDGSTGQRAGMAAVFPGMPPEFSPGRPRAAADPPHRLCGRAGVTSGATGVMARFGTSGPVQGGAGHGSGW